MLLSEYCTLLLDLVNLVDILSPREEMLHLDQYLHFIEWQNMDTRVFEIFLLVKSDLRIYASPLYEFISIWHHLHNDPTCQTTLLMCPALT